MASPLRWERCAMAGERPARGGDRVPRGKDEEQSAGDIFNIDLGDIDFDLGDFDFSGVGLEPDTRTRICKPKIDTEILTQTCHFAHAKEFAEKVDLEQNKRTFAWVSGAFIMGDLPEALWRVRGVGIKEMHVASLSVSEENIDSWAGMMKLGMIEHFDLLLSAYFYSHEKYNIVPLIYERLDQGNRFQVAYGPYHCKIMALRTYKGNTILIHGSANTRSSSNVEQIMIEVNSGNLFDFNVRMIKDLCEKYGTINHKAKPQTRKQMNEYMKHEKEMAEK